MIPYGAARCPDCQREHDAKAKAKAIESKRARDRRYNARRDPKQRAFYNSKEWKALSARVMAAAGYRCASCGKPLGSKREDGSVVVLEVDHIEPIQSTSGWEKRFDEKNLRCLCTYCHNRKHGRFTPRGG
ncbi:HNH endonuclease [uncultured Dubosiella sp.]|uniref:HNH endonuclease n=1 Tax=uncultured Dubosiella sp. TaxID=1937011 RepID=UPI0025B4F627|nr:HNH endonuclease signature motif containing protein [uncultured Dubosiella sp.]